MRVLRPFLIRDFALLWAGLTVSLLGDGVYLVALPWLVYQLSNDPTALSLTWIAWTLPHVASLVVGGPVSDRFERRRVMIAANAASGASLGAIAVLSLAGRLELWHIWALIAVHGAGVAFFVPAAGAIVPELVPEHLLVEANSLRNFIRPLMLRSVGPALGGFVIAAFGIGEAFLFDALTFVFAVLALSFVRRRPRPAVEGTPSFGHDLVDGFKFVRTQAWLALSLLAAGLWLFVTVGPIEVLIPFLVKYDIKGGAEGLGFVFAAGGVGAVIASLAQGQRGRLPRRPLVFVYVSWAISTFAVAAIALAGTLWEAMLASAVLFGLSAAGDVVWQTLLQRRVPGELLGRVSSLDWLASAGLVPISFALTGPVASAAGASTTLFSAGAIGGVLMLAFLLAPVLREEERPQMPAATKRPA